MAQLRLQEMMEELDLTETEREFIEDARTHVTEDQTAARVMAEVYLAYRLREIADDVIESNRKHTKASNRYARGLNWLTGVLAVFTLLQVLVAGGVI